MNRAAALRAICAGLAALALHPQIVGASAPGEAPPPAFRSAPAVAAAAPALRLARAAPTRAVLPVARPGSNLARAAQPLPEPYRPEAFRPQSQGLAAAASPLPRPTGDAARGLCADWRLEGEIVEPIEGPGRCGIPLPVLVRRVAGIALDPPKPMNCRTARALAAWAEKGPSRAARRHFDGAQVEALLVSGTYACRTRNFKPGGRLSEHSVGNAIDIHAFRLSDGRVIRLLQDWRRGARGDFLLASWRAACGPFGTVLGPDADVYHKDHFHFDTASRTRGAYCR
ncbi:MAG: extensin family protein [Pseudomonadota bacterium]